MEPGGERETTLRSPYGQCRGREAAGGRTAAGEEPVAAHAGGFELGHQLGIYGSRCDGDAPDRRATYIHSKLLLVDDRFLSIGSANCTTRSMGGDTELQVSWEATGHDEADEQLRERIRTVRVSLLEEHAGLENAPATARTVDLDAIDGLVSRLDRLASHDNARLVRQEGTSAGKRLLVKLFDPEALPF